MRGEYQYYSWKKREMTKQRATFSSFCNSSEACWGPRMCLKVQPGPCSPSMLQRELVGWALPVAVHSQICTHSELCQPYGRGFCVLCVILCRAAPAAPSSQVGERLKYSQAVPAVLQGLSGARRGCRGGSWLMLQGFELCLVHLHMDKEASLRQRGLIEGLHNSPKCNFINLHSCKGQYSSFGSGYFFLDIIFTAVIVLICLLTVKSLFIRTSAFVCFFAKHPLISIATYCKVFF